MDIPHFIYLSLEGYLGCYQSSAVTNNAALDIYAQVLHGYKFTFLLGMNLGMEILGHSMFKLLKNCQIVQNIFYSYFICR